MWSNQGRSRKAARSNSLVPQPVSGVASRNSRARMPLASREAQRLLPLSRRAIRQPAYSFTSGGPASRAASSFGRSAGSFWPSPSRVATQVARAALTPVRMAALWPLWRRCCSTRSSGVRVLAARSSSTLPSLLWSSTTMISKASRPRSAAAISSTRAPMLPCSLKAGTTTESSGGYTACEAFRRGCEGAIVASRMLRNSVPALLRPCGLSSGPGRSSRAPVHHLGQAAFDAGARSEAEGRRRRRRVRHGLGHVSRLHGFVALAGRAARGLFDHGDEAFQLHRRVVAQVEQPVRRTVAIPSARRMVQGAQYTGDDVADMGEVAAHPAVVVDGDL